MKKLFALFTLCLLTIPLAWGAKESFDFTNIPDFTSWTSSYAEHEVVGTAATVVFSEANKQTATIDDCPVTKGKPVTVTINEAVASKITGFKLVLRQWGTKTQTVTLNVSDDGTTFTSTTTTSSNFVLEKTSGLSAKAIKFTFSSQSNQVGVESLDLYYEKASSVPTDQVATPTFSVAEGTYSSAQSVSISCATSGASIYYTMDGSTPTTSSTPYTGAITVSTTTTLKAIAVKSGMTDSEVATATYTINSGSSNPKFAMIIFDTSSSSGTEITNPKDYIIETGKPYVSSATASKCYTNYGGVRISSNSNAGSFTLNLSDLIRNKVVTKIEVYAKRYNNLNSAAL